jgi:Interferon-alpha/beta receptor, fibronectin type III.
MKIRRHIGIIFHVILLMNPIVSYAQKDPCLVPPVSPLFKSVSVQPETGYAELTWNLSPSPGIAAYIIYKYSSGSAYAIDTLKDPSATSYLYHSTGTKYYSESYVVAAKKLTDCASPLSNILVTIFCSTSIDTCKKQIHILWNHYTNYPLKVLEYRILVSKNGSPLAEMFTVDSLASSFTMSDFETDTRYCFVVRAELEGGVVSNSNKSCLDTKMQRPPQWINADYATVTNEGKIDLSFTFDQLSEINNYSLERKTGATGSYQSTAALNSGSGSLNYTDNSADILKVNYYRIAAINNCNLPVKYSNTASNIVLELNRNQDIINLTWNHYRQWNGTIGSDKLHIYTGNGIVESHDLVPGDTLFDINYSDLMYKVSGGEVCFTIEEDEASNPFGAAGISLSNKVCIPVTERISVPNTFTPDHNLVNDTFRPVLSFTPSNYRLVITDIKRRTLFESSDYTEEWDGTINGSALPEGVYMWFLKVVTPSGKTISKTGTVNIIFNQ